MKTKHAPSWFPLDNSAKIYPPAASRHFTTLFRWSVTLSEPVDEEMLRIALEHTLKRFPLFSCRLRRGFFWYFLETTTTTPPIHQENRNPFHAMNLKEKDNILIKVFSYYNRISIEYFHALTDGNGGAVFILSLVAEYLRLAKGIEVEDSDFVKSCLSEPSPSENRDLLLEYARKESLDRKEAAAYHLSGTETDMAGALIISGRLRLSEVKALAKEHQATITQFLTALLMYSIYLKQKEEPDKRKKRMPVKICVPVDIRRFYHCFTMRNFSSYVNLSLESRLGEYSFEEILTLVKAQLTLRVTEKQINAQFSANVAAERVVAIRAIPLFIKKPVMKFIYLHEGDRYCSSTISNIGKIELPPAMRPWVKEVNWFLGPTPKSATNMVVLSYGDDLFINFTRKIKETDIERLFFSTLVSFGAHVYVESNGGRE